MFLAVFATITYILDPEEIMSKKSLYFSASYQFQAGPHLTFEESEYSIMIYRDEGNTKNQFRIHVMGPNRESFDLAYTWLGVPDKITTESFEKEFGNNVLQMIIEHLQKREGIMNELEVEDILQGLPNIKPIPYSVQGSRVTDVDISLEDASAIVGEFFVEFDDLLFHSELVNSDARLFPKFNGKFMFEGSMVSGKMEVRSFDQVYQTARFGFQIRL